jgi:hypothetical protein
MSQAINTAVANTLKAAASFQARVADLRAALPRATLADRDALVCALRPGVAKFYGIEHAEHGATGKFVCDNDKVSMAARTALSKLVRAVQGPVAHERVEVKVRVASAERAAYSAFLAACGGDAKRMAAVIKACKA